MKENISISLRGIAEFISYEEVLALAQQSVRHLEMLNKGTGAGSDFLGWIKLPENISKQLDGIEKAAKHLRSVSDTTVIIGIGGSYLGARAVIEALSFSFPRNPGKGQHELIYAGHNICDE
jgi:glucose-6-phosphate isomerase